MIKFKQRLCEISTTTTDNQHVREVEASFIDCSEDPGRLRHRREDYGVETYAKGDEYMIRFNDIDSNCAMGDVADGSYRPTFFWPPDVLYWT